MIGTVNPRRIALARERRGLTKIEFARKVGITTKRAYMLETGQSQPTDEELESIAFVLRFPVAFFLRGDVVLPAADVASFRALSSMKASERNAALAAGAIAFELSCWIDDRFELQPASLPDLRDLGAEEAAVALRAHWGIGQRPIGNMIHLLEHKGVRVFSLAEGNRNVDAFSILFQDRPFVFLNGMKTPEHSRMDAAHELGHLVLHRRHGMLKSGGNAEKEAQVFASSFLMPEESVHAAIPRIATPSLRQLIQLKKYWRVSVAALAYRLRSLGLLSDWYYRAICIEISKCGRTREPEGIERESSQVLTKVFSGLKESGLSRAEVARQLGLYVNDLDALVFGLGVIGAVPGAPAGPSEPEGTKDQAANERRKNLRIV